MAVTDFWEYCQKLYAEPGIEDLCLYLQDAQQVNVLVVLWCSWLEVRGENVSCETLQTGYQHVCRLSDPALVPLRQVRRFIKTEQSLSSAADQIRGHILAAELAIEKSLLRDLEGLSGKVAASSSETTLPALDRLTTFLGLHSNDWLSGLRAAAGRVHSL